MNDEQMQGGGNPFEEILKQFQGGKGGVTPTMDAGPMMATQPAPAGPKIGPDGKPLPDVTQRGQNPGTSKFVIQAMQAMQGAMAEATDPEEIQMLRQILQLLVKIVDMDQSKQGAGQPSPAMMGMNPAQMMAQ
jgi:hypothetical protein